MSRRVLTVTLDTIGSLGSAGVLENLLDVHVHLAEHGRRCSAAIGFVGEQGHALLNAERLEDCLGDPEWKAVEWPDENDAVEVFICGVQALAYGRSNFTKDLRRDVFALLSNTATTSLGLETSAPMLVPTKDMAPRNCGRQVKELRGQAKTGDPINSNRQGEGTVRPNRGERYAFCHVVQHTYSP